MRTRHIIFALIFVILAAGGGFAFFLSQPTVTVAHPVRGPAVEAVYATGEVEPVRWAKVSPKSTARIVEILAREGDRVQRHQLLARLSDDEAGARVDQLATQERTLRDEVQRLTPLLPKGYVGKQAYDRAVSEHRQSRATLDAARHVLDDLRLRSPMSGVVLRQDGEVGETANSMQVLFWVGELKPLRITAEVDEEDILRIRPGSRTLIKADAFPGQVLEGRVAEITPKGDPVNKSYRVRVALPDDTPLKTGMTTEINIIARETNNALLIPASAVTNNTVWVVRAGKAERVAVKTGAATEQRIEITAGLADNDDIIVAPPADLKPGQSVRAKVQPAP
ncbi:MAG: efflux RND transporter periplasmic adaptor subunit [Gammaproteobacteria bacterium]|nr:efflux RND transporter periplasmic adaptor subunit [Gammaproteobacteria bacterium]